MLQILPARKQSPLLAHCVQQNQTRPIKERRADYITHLGPTEHFVVNTKQHHAYGRAFLIKNTILKSQIKK